MVFCHGLATVVGVTVVVVLVLCGLGPAQSVVFEHGHSTAACTLASAVAR